MRNIRFVDVKSHGGEWPASAALVRCNASNPCRGLVFQDVVLDADAFVTGRKYVCDDRDAAAGVATGDNAPDPRDCLRDDDDDDGGS